MEEKDAGVGGKEKEREGKKDAREEMRRKKKKNI